MYMYVLFIKIIMFNKINSESYIQLFGDFFFLKNHNHIFKEKNPTGLNWLSSIYIFIRENL